LISLELKLGGATQRTIQAAIKGQPPTWPIHILGAPVSPQQILAVAVLVGLALGMVYFFNKSDYGLAILALSQEPVATELTGIGAKRMSSLVWVMAAVLGGVAGILHSGLTQVIYPGFVSRDNLLFAFTAAVVGGITSLSGAFVGGLLIGVVYSLGNYADSNFIHHVLPGVPDLAVFVVLLAILLARPKGLLGKEA
jgi:branched-chain amino acid transport system permease protein